MSIIASLTDKYSNKKIGIDKSLIGRDRKK